MMGSFMGRGNQYIQLVKVRNCGPTASNYCQPGNIYLTNEGGCIFIKINVLEILIHEAVK